jgi:cellulose synthase/poly-beta-1,6-N-acetylglucosamine synthase-like glycosyltransferase
MTDDQLVPRHHISVALFSAGADGATASAVTRLVVDPDATRLVPVDLAVELTAVPILRQGQVLTVAMTRLDDMESLRRLSDATGLRIRAVVASEQEIRSAIGAVYDSPDPAIQDQRSRDRHVLGQLLRREGVITDEQLAEALRTQKRTGERLGRILVRLGFINRPTLGRALAQQLRIPFQNLILNPPEDALVRLLDEATSRRLQVIVTGMVEDAAIVAFADPLDQAARRELEERLGRHVRRAVTSEVDVQWTLRRVYREEYIERSTADLLLRHPEESAAEPFTTAQIAWLFVLLSVLFLSSIWLPIPTLITVNAIFTVLYLAASAYRLLLLYRGATNNLEVNAPPEEIAALRPSDLPTYTIFVPLFREKEVLPTLLSAVAALDYEPTKLEVLLLFEETDVETLEAARAMQPPAHFDFVVVPDAMPRTKPKACNYGLIQATGRYCVIYDAEDIPDPDQLKKAVVAFRQVGDDVACIQAKLNYFNQDQNLLTRWFTSEYSMWFDLVLPGLDSMSAPIPLGGTSNHFVTEKLRELGAWDPYNVTEDADLGIRLHKAGYRTAVIDSTTYEEANSDVFNWIRQRSRWVKGYMQTWLVHMRHPIELWRSVGTRAFLSFQLTIGATPLLYLLNPIYWFLTILWALTSWDVIRQIFPTPVYYMGAICLVFGNFSFMYVAVAGCLMRSQYKLIRYAVLTPIYWVLMTIAAWRAAYQLVVKPFYWEKTQHGLHLKKAMTAPGTPHD